MAWGNFLRKALPIAAGVIGSPALGAAVGAGMQWWGAHEDAKAQQAAAAQAGQTAMGGFNYLSSSPVGQQYLPAGGQAAGAQAALLGIGGDPAAANAAYQNYLASTGYQGQLRAGTDAITSNAAASGALGSGATLKALQQYGTQLGQQSFTNYLGQLQGVAGMGMQAGSLIGGAAQSGGSQAAGYQYGAGVNAASARREGWQNGRAPAGKSAAAAVKTPMYPPNTNAFQRWGGRPAY
jgi:hypothetical protein